ncbi:MAG: amino acid adenylation domain-containing protein [Pseudomonadota bacterium]
MLLDNRATKTNRTGLSDAPIRNTERTAPLTPQSLAYVIYTSGSTGYPKGVMVGHGELENYISCTCRSFGGGEPTVMLHRTTLGFDYSAQELWWPLTTGSSTVVAQSDISDVPSSLVQLIEQAKITTIVVVPALLAEMLPALTPERASSIRQVLCGGEALPAILAAQASVQCHHLELVNHYGPTEATINATSYKVPIELVQDDIVIPIGAPVANTQVYVLDERLSSQPVGIPGELVIGGLQVSRGYLGRPGLTSEKFIADPFSGEPGARLYRTGDLARWRADGTLEFLGRIDNQVKIRGMRVEPGEIEAALTTIEAVAQAAVVARTAGGDTQLMAYLVPAETSDTERTGGPSLAEDRIDLEQVRSALKRTLPDHMVPSGYGILSHLPLTASGKVDRNALPAVDMAVAQAPYTPPRNEREALMCQIMRDVIAHDRLSLERVGVDDHFFDIGGHSIFAAQFAMRLETALGQTVPVRLVFEAPTVRALAERLDENHVAARPPLTLTDRSKPIPASFEQERMWLANAVHADRPVYNEGLPLVLRGAVDTGALLAAVQGILERYEVLRTRLAWQEGRLVQLIDPPGALKVAFEDWSDRREAMETIEAEAAGRASTLIAAPYDLASDHPCRALVIKLPDRSHTFTLATHHVVGDNWSLSHVMPADILALYDAARVGHAANLPAIERHYADYAAWQRSDAMAPVLEAERTYWQEALAGAPEILDLPTDRPRPAVRSHAGARRDGAGYDAATWRAVERFAVAHDGTPFMVLVAGLSALLARVTRTDDIVIGTPHVMKPDAALWDEFGYFGNTLALRTKVDLLTDFAAHFAAVRQTVMDAFRHQDVPFEQVVEALGVKPSNATPVYQVMLIMHAYLDTGAFAHADFALEGLGDNPAVAKTDLTLDINPGADGVAVSLEYATDIFDDATVTRLAAMLQRLIAAALAAPETVLADLPLMDGVERNGVVGTFNDTAVAVPNDQTVVDLFAAQVAARPDGVAVVDGETTLTYAALDAASNRLARRIITLGVGPEVVVGVCMERSADLIITLLAIWKAGGTYLPLDPKEPEERLSFMLHDAAATLIVRTAARSIATEPEGDLCLDDPTTAAAIASCSAAAITDRDRIAPLTPATLAYVIYTSGSTGTPKGVAQAQATLTSLWDWHQDERFAASATVLWTPIIFDVSVQEIAVPLLMGGPLVVAPSDLRRDAVEALQFLDRLFVQSVFLPPTLLVRLADAADSQSLPGLEGRHIIACGETLTIDPRIERQVTSRLDNHYGPAETHVVTASTLPQTRPWPELPDIGRPLAKSRVYVLDERLSSQPVGIPGELVIGGVQVARGYLGRPGLTAEKFIADPFSGEPGARLYRTGDLARWRPDGTLEFLGRIDTQMKIRGMRVEPGEIEATLTKLDAVAQAAVVARKAGGDTQLMAYLVPAKISETERTGGPLLAEDRIDLGAVRSALKRTLPDHMVPSGYAVLSRLPLTASGKVDRKALPVAEISVARTAYEAPQGATETLVAAAFAKILGVERVGRHDSFFDLGGHSLMVVRLTAHFQATAGRTVPIRTLFEAPTVAGLASALTTRDSASYTPLVPIPAAGSTVTMANGRDRFRVVCFHGVAGTMLPFTAPQVVEPLSAFGPVLAFQARGHGPGEAPFASYSQMLACYLDAVEALETDRPLVFVGWSMGGGLAHDLAAQLARRGRAVAGIAILDSVHEAARVTDGIQGPSASAKSFEEFVSELVGTQWPGTADRIHNATAESEKWCIVRDALIASGQVSPDMASDAPDWVERFLQTVYSNTRLLDSRQRSEIYPGPVLVLRAQDTRNKISDPTLGWSAVCRSVDTIDVAHDHFDLFNAAAVPDVIAAVYQWLDMRLTSSPASALPDPGLLRTEP